MRNNLGMTKNSSKTVHKTIKNNTKCKKYPEMLGNGPEIMENCQEMREIAVKH